MTSGLNKYDQTLFPPEGAYSTEQPPLLKRGEFSLPLHHSDQDDWKTADRVHQLSLRSISSSSGSIKEDLQALVSGGLRLAAVLVENPHADLGTMAEEAEEMSAKVTEFLDLCRNNSSLSERKYFTLIHELRTPLQGLIGSLEFPERSREFFEKIQQIYKNLLILLEDIPNDPDADVHLELRPAPFELQKSLDLLDLQIRPYASRFGVTVLYNIAPELNERYLVGDKRRIGQLLINLISNAIKYSPPGEEVVVSIGTRDDRIVFSVADKGDGIPLKKQNRLFQPFSQLKKDEGCFSCFKSCWNSLFGEEKKTVVPSSGVGLYFCKQLAELMNDGTEGNIGVVSDPDRAIGSTFWFSIPYQWQPKAASLPPSPMPHVESLHFAQPNLDVLAADDSSVCRKTLAKFISSCGNGASLELANDGVEAVSKFRAHTIVILDMEMPNKGGLDAAAEIHALAGRSIPPHIILATGNPPDEVEEELQRRGLDRAVSILGKPLKSRELVREVNRRLASSEI
jgi:CheY-like chemotaxis protein